MTEIASSNSENVPIPAGRFTLRLVWVVVQLLLVYWLGESGAQFIYQGF
jgi:hypothetical protein